VKRPTLTDVAGYAGVSYATADRAVNNRGRVSPKAVEKVQAAVRALGYVRNVAAANLSQGRRYRFAFVLPEGPNAFFQNIRQLLQSQGSITQDVDVHGVSAFDADNLADHLLTLTDAGLDGIAIVGLDADALIPPLDAFLTKKTPVVSLISDLPQHHRAAYIGIDNVAAGRTAARLMGQSHGGQPGIVQVIVGDMAARDHHERMTGFRAVLETDFPQVRMLPVMQSGDSANRVEQHIQHAVKEPGLTGIYNAGAGNIGLARAVQRRGRRPFIGVHELTPHARTALEANLFDYIIDQRPEAEIEAALNLLRALADDVPPPPIPDILPTVYVRDNLPPMSKQGRDVS
jgi:LacI family transcriptional regulator